MATPEHKRLTLRLSKRLKKLTPKPDRELKRYTESHRRDLLRGFERSNEMTLLSEVFKSRLTLVGDFHGDPQGVRTLLRIARESKRPLTLALEAFASDHQRYLNRYLKGILSLERLRHLTQFDNHWGYAWAPYAELLEFSKNQKIAVVGIDLPKLLNSTQVPRGKTLLSRRDRWMSGHLKDLTSTEPSRVVVALVGELHLASAHLPRALQRLGCEMPHRIHPAPPSLYWKSPETRVFQRGTNEFAVSMTPPWVRLQSQLQWMDGLADEDLTLDPHPDLETALGELGSIQSLLQREQPDITRISFEFDPKKEYPELSPRTQKLTSGALHFNTRSEIAALVLYREHSLGSSKQDQRLRRMCFAEWVSLLHNPRRKFDRAEDLALMQTLSARRALKLLSGKPTPSTKKAERLASQVLATAILEKTGFKVASIKKAAIAIESTPWTELCKKFKPRSIKRRKPRAL